MNVEFILQPPLSPWFDNICLLWTPGLGMHMFFFTFVWPQESRILQHLCNIQPLTIYQLTVQQLTLC